MNTPRKSTQLLFATLMAFYSSLALASGSDGAGRAQTGDGASYNLGKRVYAVKLGCDSCPMADMPLNKQSAEKLLQGGVEVELSAREEEALTVYLKRRFKL